MVVDDEPMLVEMVCESLEDAGIAAMSCTESQEAYASMRRHQPDVVILDVQMPEVDGLKVFRQMRADPAMRQTPVIFFTANINKLRRWIPDYQSLGAELLPKPFDIDRLLELVQQVMTPPQPDQTSKTISKV
jgi:two-component system, OmpR family, response regulator